MTYRMEWEEVIKIYHALPDLTKEMAFQHYRKNYKGAYDVSAMRRAIDFAHAQCPSQVTDAGAQEYDEIMRLQGEG